MNTIYSDVLRLFSREHRKQLHLQEQVKGFLASVPQCSGIVLVADASYGDGEYACRVMVSAEDLMLWSQAYLAQTIVQSVRQEAVRQALPVWLAGAKSDDRKVTNLPHEAFSALSDEIAGWVRNGVARVECPGCGTIVSPINMTKTDEERWGDKYYWWTDVWTCPSGHELLKVRNHTRTYFLSPRKSIR